MRSEAFDVVVIGAGPAGLSAAVRAAEAGARVALVDQQPHPGGQIWRSDAGEIPESAQAWRDRAQAANVAWFPESTVVDVPAAKTILATQPDGAMRLTTRALILATGACERYLPFPGSTLPGVTGAGGLQALVKGGTPVHGQRVLLAGTGPLLLAVADSLLARGATIPAIVEQASFFRLLRFAPRLLPDRGKMAQLLDLRRRLHAVPRLYGSWITRVTQASGELLVTVASGRSRHRTLRVDRVAVGYGLFPDLRIPAMLGCRLVGDRVAVDDHQRTSVPNVYCAGEPTGIGGVEKALVEGQIAGLSAAGQHERIFPENLQRKRRRAHRFARSLDLAFRLRPELKEAAVPESIVCRCEDVTMAQISSAPDPRTARLLHRCGMGSCQGRMCSGALSFLCGWTPPSPRPPLFPTPIQTLIDTWPSPPTDHTP